MKTNLLIRVLSSLGGLALIAVIGHVNARHASDPDMKIVVYALSAGTALAACTLAPMWSSGRRILALLACCGVLCGEIYSLAATSERTLAARDARQAEKSTANQVWNQRKEALDAAIAVASSECGSGRGPRCLTAEGIVDQKRSVLSGTTVPVEVNRLASLFGLMPEKLDLYPILAAIAMTTLGFAMVAFGNHATPVESKPVQPVQSIPLQAITEGEPMPSDAELEELRKLLIGKTMTNDELASHLGISKGHASRTVSAAVQAGLLTRARQGRHVAISARSTVH